MIFQKQSSQETWYDILNVEEDASYEDIRGNYRSALLNSHPDKLQQSSDKQNTDVSVDTEDRFLKVQKAWEILSDSSSRAFYDTELRALRRTDDVVVADDISLEDMMVESGDGSVLELYYQCRCGDYFSVSALELDEEMGYRVLRDDKGEISVITSDGMPGTIVLPCGSCSLKVRLVIDVDGEVESNERH